MTAVNAAEREIAALIDTLHSTGRRLEELTGGEVDSVMDGEGRAFLLQHAQDELRLGEAARRASILDALPANIALLDARGVIVSVNESWRHFARANAMKGPRLGIGLNYLAACDAAAADDAPQARHAAQGIRAVLEGRRKAYSIEYPCHSPGEQRWFLMAACALAEGRAHGAVVMHMDISAQRSRDEELVRFAGAMDAVTDAIYVMDRTTMRFVHVNDAACRMQGRTRAELLALGPGGLLAIPRPELERIYDAIIASGVEAPALETQRTLADGSPGWVEVRRHALRSGDRWTIATLVRDITGRRRAAEELRSSDAMKAAILEASLDCIITMDGDGRIVEFNRAAVETFGFTREQALGSDVADLIIPPRLRAAHRRGHARYLATGQSTMIGRRIELDALRADGTEFPIELTITTLGGTSTPMLTSFIRDISARRESEERLRRLNRVYAVLSGINSLIVRVSDRDELFSGACRIAVEDGGFRMAWIATLDTKSGILEAKASAGDVGNFFATSRLATAHNEPGGAGLPGRAIREMVPMVANDVGQHPDIVGKHDLTGRGINSVALIPLIVAGGSIGVLALYSADIGFFDAEEMRLLQELGSDIAFAVDHIGKQDRIEYLAYYDALTGLPNRSLFLGRVAQGMLGCATSGSKLALAIVDLERFKSINDTLGRPAGDALLKQVAQWLTRTVGDASLLAHLGADRFAILVPVVRREGAVRRLVEKSVRAFLEHPFDLEGSEFRIAAKVGVAIFPNDGANADSLFKHAEAALKRAKASGDRLLLYEPTMSAQVAGKLTLENQLRQALDKGEFVLHYQPKFGLASGKVAGAEALIRWNDPRTGLVPPGRFIPVLEETGLIHDVGRWALHQAVNDYLRWRAAGLAAVRIAVNVSPLQLRARGFLAEVRNATSIDTQAAHGLELEITEGVVMEDVKHSIASLLEIRAMGVTVAIDDFGTGFSSLSYLAKLPVDALKIDRSFVADITVGPEGLALVSTIINLAHSLKLKVVAEGVETEEQSRLLRLLDCDEMQGFLMSKPVPRESFESLFLAPPAKR